MTEFPIKREENETQSMLDSLYIKVRNQANVICGDREQFLSFMGAEGNFWNAGHVL